MWDYWLRARKKKKERKTRGNKEGKRKKDKAREEEGKESHGLHCPPLLGHTGHACGVNISIN